MNFVDSWLILCGESAVTFPCEVTFVIHYRSFYHVCYVDNLRFGYSIQLTFLESFHGRCYVSKFARNMPLDVSKFMFKFSVRLGMIE